MTVSRDDLCFLASLVALGAASAYAYLLIHG